MAARSKSREEAEFARGDVGVDGQATEETKDLAEVERTKAREQFLRGKAYLGREFLTWLLWRSESGEPVVKVDGEGVLVLLTARLVLRGIAGEVVETVMRGAMAPYSPLVRKSLDRGLLIHATRLRLMHGEQTFEVSLDADYFDLKSAKLPPLMAEEEDDQLHERLFLTEKLAQLVQALLEEFLRVRASKRWAKDVAAMKEWMAEVPAEPPRRKAAGER